MHWQRNAAGRAGPPAGGFGAPVLQAAGPAALQYFRGSPVLTGPSPPSLLCSCASTCHRHAPSDADTARAVGSKEVQALSQCIAQLWARVKEYGVEKCGVLEIKDVTAEECPGDYA